MNETVPLLTPTKEVCSVAHPTSTPVRGDRVDQADFKVVISWMIVLVFSPGEEVLIGAPSASTPASEDHFQHTDHSSFVEGKELHYKFVRGNDLSEMCS